MSTVNIIVLLLGAFLLSIVGIYYYTHKEESSSGSLAERAMSRVKKIGDCCKRGLGISSA
jgi:hypothetical protein